MSPTALCHTETTPWMAFVHEGWRQFHYQCLRSRYHYHVCPASPRQVLNRTSRTAPPVQPQQPRAAFTTRTFNRRLRMFRQHATYIPNDFRRVQVRRVPWRTSALVSQWVHAELEDRPSCGKVHRARMDQRHEYWILNGNVSELGDAGRACHG